MRNGGGVVESGGEVVKAGERGGGRVVEGWGRGWWRGGERGGGGVVEGW